MMQDDRTNAQAMAGLFDTDMLMSDEFSRKKQKAQAAPMSMLEQMDQRHGKLKSRLGLFSHLYNGGSQANYGDADMLAEQKQMQTQQALQDKMGMAQPLIEMAQSNDPMQRMEGMYGLGQLGFDQNMMNMAMPGYSPASELPDATRAVIHYQDSLNRYVDENTGEVMMREPGDEGYVKYADAFDRYKNREIGGLQAQAEARASGAATGKIEAEAAATEESRMPQMQNAFDLVTSILDDPDKNFHNAYGVIDSMTPTVRQSTADVESKISQIGDILYMFARGELKGQGQVTEQEAEAARNAASRLKNMRMSEAEAEQEMRRLQRQFGDILGLDPSTYSGEKSSGTGVATQNPAGRAPMPAVGAEVNGFVFKGGNPNDPTSWEKAQ